MSEQELDVWVEQVSQWRARRQAEVKTRVTAVEEMVGPLTVLEWREFLPWRLIEPKV